MRRHIRRHNIWNQRWRRVWSRHVLHSKKIIASNHPKCWMMLQSWRWKSILRLQYHKCSPCSFVDYLHFDSNDPADQCCFVHFGRHSELRGDCIVYRHVPWQCVLESRWLWTGTRCVSMDEYTWCHTVRRSCILFHGAPKWIKSVYQQMVTLFVM